MRIGLDFDGVLEDNGALKSVVAAELFDVDVEPGYFSSDYVVEEQELLTEEEYRQVQETAYFDWSYGKEMEPLPYMKEYLSRLQEDGHELFIITARDEGAAEIARLWLGKHQIAVPVIDVGRDGSKAAKCEEYNIDLFVDDKLKNLEEIEDAVDHRLLFSWPRNEDEAAEDVKRIDHWPHLYGAAYWIAEHG